MNVDPLLGLTGDIHERLQIVEADEVSFRQAPD